MLLEPLEGASVAHPPTFHREDLLVPPEGERLGHLAGGGAESIHQHNRPALGDPIQACNLMRMCKRAVRGEHGKRNGLIDRLVGR